jgi:hypothetical protein
MVLTWLLTLFLQIFLGHKVILLNFSILLIVIMSSDIVDIDRALGGDLWVAQETEQLQRTFTKMVGSLVSDSEDVWVKGPAKMSADFIHLINNDSSKTVYSSLIRTIKNRRYRYVSRVKRTRTSIC